MYPIRFILLFGGLLFGAASSAQTEAQWRSLFRAEELITTARHDSALFVLKQLRTTILPEVAGSRKFDQRVRLLMTQAQLGERDYAAAAKDLLRLLDEAGASGNHAIEAEAAIRMALIHQRQDRPEECLDYLQRAEWLIEQHRLWELRPQLNNRKSTYHRHFTVRDSSLVYARLALRQAQELDDEHQLALAHLNISLYYRSTDTKLSEYHLERSADYYRNTGSASDYLVMTLVLNSLQVRAGRYAEALTVNDSAMVYVRRVKDDSTFLSRVYKLRADVMNGLGKSDSAWFYLQKAYYARLDYLERVNAERAVEIEAAYKNEKQDELIASQEQQLRLESRRRYELLAIGLFGFTLLFLLYYFVTRIQRAREAIAQQEFTEKQNQALNKSLAEQKVLQGEIHHRVKNNLQIMVGLMDMQRRRLTDPSAQATLEAMSGRIFSMAAVHEILYQEGRAGEINFKQYAQKICDHFRGLCTATNRCSFEFNIPDTWFNLETAVPLGIMFNELLTNSYKYAKLAPGKALKICVSLTEGDGELCLEYSDNGAGFSEAALAGQRQGLGSQLLRGMSRQLRGRVEFSNETGALTRIYFYRKVMYGAETENEPAAVSLN